MSSVSVALSKKPTICADCVHQNGKLCGAEEVAHEPAKDVVTGAEHWIDKDGIRSETDSPWCSDINEGECPHFSEKN